MGLASLPSKLTVFEKTNYLFKNWRHASAGTVIFPGCGFTSFFPKTLAALKDALLPSPGVSFAIDCCGLPLAGLKGPEAYRAELSRVEERLVRVGAREVVPLCPNCGSAFTEVLDRSISQVTIYACLRDLTERGLIDCARVATPGAVFVPCPDRAHREWLDDLAYFLEPSVFVSECSACCGAAFELSQPEASMTAAKRVLETAAHECTRAGVEEPVLYVYCASCAGKLERARRQCSGGLAGSVRVVHVLSALMGVDEAPAVSTTVLNRAKAAIR